LEVPDTYCKIILRWIFRKWVVGMDWIKLAQDRGKCRALLNAAINLRVPKNRGAFLLKKNSAPWRK
jgi:hypothetical protein